jgi:hypothetical protein
VTVISPGAIVPAHGRKAAEMQDGEALAAELGWRERDGCAVDRQPRPEARQHALSVVARAHGFCDGDGPVRPETGQQQRRLDLG